MYKAVFRCDDILNNHDLDTAFSLLMTFNQHALYIQTSNKKYIVEQKP
tara:strand:+ start:19530 stop:19673 length:144 start_codon:yes stop_codon:yes gene_type:complete